MDVTEDGDGFFVADDGVGVPDERKDEVLDRGYTTAEEGTGLGLAIVNDIAAAHGWTVSVSDSDDEGARFDVSGVQVVEAVEN